MNNERARNTKQFAKWWGLDADHDKRNSTFEVGQWGLESKTNGTYAEVVYGYKGGLVRGWLSLEEDNDIKVSADSVGAVLEQLDRILVDTITEALGDNYTNDEKAQALTEYRKLQKGEN